MSLSTSWYVLNRSNYFIRELKQYHSQQVEGTVFIVNRQNFINDSEFFQEMYELPPTKDKPVDGSSVDHPLLIEGVNKSDIVLLLRAMFPQYVSNIPSFASPVI